MSRRHVTVYRLVTLATVAVCGLMLAACQAGPGGSGSSAELVGPRWVLATYVDADGASASVLSQTETWIVLADDGSFSANTGVNDLKGSWEGDDELVTFAPGAITERGASAELMAQERAFVDGLEAARGYIVAGQGSERALSVRDGSGAELLVFDAAQAIPLAGSEWSCTGYDNGEDSVMALAVGSEISATFGEDGTLSGNAGCNDYSASLEVGDTDVTIGPEVELTTKACPADIAAQEASYIAAIKRSATYVIVGTRLELLDARGVRMATFELAR